MGENYEAFEINIKHFVKQLLQPFSMALVVPKYCHVKTIEKQTVYSSCKSYVNL